MWDEHTEQTVSHWLVTDHQGSVRQVLAMNGAIVNTIGYDAFGQPDLPASFLHLNEIPMVPDYQPVDVTVTVAAPSSKLIAFDDVDPHDFELDDLLVLIRDDEQIQVVEGEDE